MKKLYYQINSIVKVFRLLEILVTKEEFRLAELCRLLNFPKTTIHRMLLSLESLGYVQQNPQSLGYRASIKIFELGAQVVRNLSFTEISKPFLVKLSEKTGETVNLGILDGIDVVCIDKEESKEHLRIDQPIGSRAKAYQTGMGKAILAYLPEQERKRLFSNCTIETSTSKSLKTISAIEEDCRKIRERGYSVDNEEYLDGVRCLGAPIFNHKGKVVAGLSIAGPISRVNEGNTDFFAGLIVNTTTLISEKLGCPTFHGTRNGEAIFTQ